MSYAQLGRDALDYQPCQYPGSPMTFRGPKCDLEEPYILCLGGSETFGKFSTDPFPDRLGDRLGRRVVNMGAMNAGVDLFLHDAAVKAAMGRAQAVVLQVPGAANMSNRFFTVHPRRNDRFAVVVEELRAAWVARIAQLIERSPVPVHLLWLSHRAPSDEVMAELGYDPLFVTATMLDEVAPLADSLSVAVWEDDGRAPEDRGLSFGRGEEAAASVMPGPADHERVSQVLAELLG